MILNIILTLLVAVIAMASIPSLVFTLVKLQDHNYQDWEPGIFKRKWLFLSIACYFITIVAAIIATTQASRLSSDSKERPQFKPVQEQLYRRVGP